MKNITNRIQLLAILAISVVLCILVGWYLITSRKNPVELSKTPSDGVIPIESGITTVYRHNMVPMIPLSNNARQDITSVYVGLGGALGGNGITGAERDASGQLYFRVETRPPVVSGSSRIIHISEQRINDSATMLTSRDASGQLYYLVQPRPREIMK